MEARLSITDLPPAVLGTILAHLPTKERARTLVCCRAWNAAASHNPEAWADVRASLSNEARVPSFVAWLAPRRHLVRSILVQQALQLPADLKAAGSSRTLTAAATVCAEEWLLVPRALAGGRCERLQLRLLLDCHLMSDPLRLTTQDLLALPHLRHWELRAPTLAVAVDLDPTQLAQLDALTALIINAPAPMPARTLDRAAAIAAANTPTLAPGIFPPALVQLGLTVYPSGLPPALPAAAAHIRSLLCSGPEVRPAPGHPLYGRPSKVGTYVALSAAYRPWGGLGEMRSLTSLSLAGCCLYDVPQAVTALSALQALDLQHNCFFMPRDEDQAAGWQPLAALTALTSLSLRNCSIGNLPIGQLLQAAAAAGSGGGLRRLDLQGNESLSLWFMAPLQGLTSLRELSLNFNKREKVPEWAWTSLEALHVNSAGPLLLPVDVEPTVTRLEASLKDLVLMEAKCKGSLKRLASLQELYLSSPPPPRGQGRALLRAVRCALPALRVLGIMHGLERDMPLPHLLRLRAERPELCILVDEDDFGGSIEETVWVEWAPPPQQQEAAEGGTSTWDGSSGEGGSTSGDSDSMVAQYVFVPDDSSLTDEDESSDWDDDSEEDSEGSSSSEEGESEEEMGSDVWGRASVQTRASDEGRKKRRRLRRGSGTDSSGSDAWSAAAVVQQQGSLAWRAAAAVAAEVRRLLAPLVLVFRVLLAWVVGLLLVRWSSLRWQSAMLSWVVRKLRQVWGRGSRPHAQ